MADVAFVAAIVAFFVLTAWFVVGCNRIIGPDPAPTREETTEQEPG